MPRSVWQPSPAAEEILAPLDLLAMIVQQPATRVESDEILVRQLGDFRELQVVDELRRVAEFYQQKMVEDPVHVARQDPQYLNFIFMLGVMDGNNR